jgi:hypothetical protein
VVLKDDFGEPNEAIVNLTTATSVVFNMRDQGPGKAVKISRGLGTITNRLGGEITYNWGSTDTSTAGTFDAEAEITWGDGKPETFPGGPTGGNYWTVIITGDIA